VRSELKDLSTQLKGIEQELAEARRIGDQREVDALREKENKLREKENKLREKENKLREKENKLREKENLLLQLRLREPSPGEEEQVALSFRTRFESEELTSTVKLSSEVAFEKWIGTAGARLWVYAEKGKKKRVREVRSLAEAIEAQAQAEASGTYLFLNDPGDKLSEDVSKLNRGARNRATGIEQQTTKAVARDLKLAEELGPLKLLNEGRGVVFCAPDGEDIVEVDGLVLNSTMLLVNEAKASPKEEDVSKFLAALGSLRAVLADPTSFRTRPPGILDDIGQGKQVVGIMSGFNFPPEVGRKCAKEGIRTVLTTGEGYGVGEEPKL